MSKKTTITQNFAKVEEILLDRGYPDLAKFIAERSALHSKKLANRKPTAVQKANEELANTIVDFMTEKVGEKFTITNLIKTIPECADLSNQKVSAVVRGLVEKDIVTKVMEKGVSLFFIAKTDE